MIKDRQRLLIISLGENRVKLDVEFSEYFPGHIKAIAEAFYIATSIRELVKVVELCRELKLDFIVLGTGSKIALDNPQGLVIKNRSDNLKIFGVKGKISREGLGIEEAFIEAESGTSLSRLSQYAASQGLGGLEELQTMSGTLGGSFNTSPLIKALASCVKVMTNENIQQEVTPQEVKKGDIILAVIFHLRTEQASKYKK